MHSEALWRTARRGSERLGRNALLASVAAGALMLAAPDHALGACTIVGVTLDCTGNLSSGVGNPPSPVSVINVHDVTSNITPAPNKDGIAIWRSAGDVTVTSDLTKPGGGTFGISVSGGEFAGIYASSHTDDKEGGSVFVTSTGNIRSQNGSGIFAKSDGVVTVTSRGDLQAGIAGIDAISKNAGNVTVRNYGDITGVINATTGVVGAAEIGIRAQSDYGYGAVYVKNAGNIKSTLTGIVSVSQKGTASVNSEGNITSYNGTGIYSSGGGAAADVTSKGNISAGQDGIFAAGGEVRTVTSTGDITAKAGRGLYARSGMVIITNNAGNAQGSIHAFNDAISAKANFNGIDVSSTGDVTSDTGYGIKASLINGYAGGIKVTSTGGTITAQRDGIRAESSARYSVNVTSTSNITSTDGNGIYVARTNRKVIDAVTITSSGVIANKQNGIRAGNSNGDINITSNNTITTTQGDGIFARGGDFAGAFDIRNYAAIEAGNTGIYANNVSGDVTVLNKASIEGKNYGGIIVFSGGKAEVTNEADVSSKYGGIKVVSGGAVTVSSTGIVTSAGGNAIQAQGRGAGKVEVTAGVAGVEATLTARGSGIIAKNDGTGDVSVTNYDTIHAGKNGTSVFAAGINAIASAGAVTVNTTAAITSDSGAGITARSFGAGDVNVTTTNTVTAAKNGIYAYSKSGTVTLSSTNDVTSTGGDGIRAGGNGPGAITVTTTGTVLASTSAIYAMNKGAGAVSVTANGTLTSSKGSGIQIAGGRGDLSVSLDGSVAGAAGHAGVEFGVAGQSLGGAANRLDITATSAVTNAGGIDDFAIIGRSGNEAVTNAGAVSGSVDLGSGSNSFLNAAGGLFTMGHTVNLGAGNTLTNSGVMSVGLQGSIASVSMTGNLVQTSGGSWAVDIDGNANAADFIAVSGTANLAGTVALNAITKPLPRQEFLILEADGGVTDSGLVLQDTAVTKLQLQYRSSESQASGATAIAAANGLDPVQTALIDQLWLGVTIDFVVDGLNPNQNAAAENLNKLVETDPGGVTPVVDALVKIPDTPSYRKALDELLPDPYIHAHMAMADVTSAGLFSDMLISCKMRDGAYAYIAEDQCGWMQAGGTSLKRDADGMDPGSQETGWWYAGGVQAELSDTLHLGVGGRYERVSQEVLTSHTEGNRGDIGAALTYDSGPLLLASSISAGRSWLDTDRHASFSGFSGTARGESDNAYVRGKLRGAYLFDFGAWYLKPQADLDATWLSYGEVKEDGGNGAALQIDSSDKTMLSASPKLEIGGQWMLANGTILRPYAATGATFYSNTEFGVVSRFRDAPAGSPSFRTELEMDGVIADVSLGLDMFGTNGTSLRVFYDGSFGETTTMHTGGLRAAIEF